MIGEDIGNDWSEHLTLLFVRQQRGNDQTSVCDFPGRIEQVTYFVILNQ